ncbi:MAG: lycopene cyclase domain-containing protein [Candidatus Heimdallarchaeota archaeon]|nr:MAG: lycopene cyclase domain-containing protein [Candidatus Heimdallarchaeota archaeon]
MTYLSFILFFILVPLIINVAYLVYRHYLHVTAEKSKNLVKTTRYFTAIIILAIIALIYTTPWDNFLVANKIWYYDINKVLGIVIGYVPIEEYIFFVVQTLLVGVFTFTFSKTLYLNSKDERERKDIRVLSTVFIFLIWLIAIITYTSQISALVYLNLILIWALPPIMLQLLFGADILWEKKVPLVFFLLISTAYLSIIDALAISANIWTISLNTSTGILIGGILPIEEMVFFLVTNVLIIFGLTLIASQKSEIRFRSYLKIVKLNSRKIKGD